MSNFSVDIVEMLSILAIREAVDVSITCAKVATVRGGNKATPIDVVVGAMRSLRLANSIAHKQGEASLLTLKNTVISTLAAAQLAHARMDGFGAIGKGLIELARAKKLYPDWPTDIVQQMSIMVEEAGEAFDAYVSVQSTSEKVQDELVQTIAMCLRVLENLPQEARA